ncbi:hypothetical protein Fleli_2681 [Bernardetia litoralis DSM 6794]|uniref:Acetoacetate decarboxylase (ADC) n=1 Tax=Bernardetia litoralis (strain ATCC 23117 / DSM 6794 / NBRC 15988 / NCIMB 1366 / Fx l1 / Sio-4) TaxID=880071 RepID=I4AM53_BERLS|nr:DUF2071 domain-containing protein [Bernardetia litoralis]AFM05038.1 hypothetical protein Fleli_2681 [Bernardetia litoralis DSM 6794]
MLDFLKKHPFPVKAFFDYSLVFSFAVPKEELQNKIPSCLELDTFKKLDNKTGKETEYAFVAVAMVKTKELRPKGFPKFMGNDFFLIGYRIFVNYIDSKGKKLRGLYILKSETNKAKMQILGGIFTQYKYSIIDINTHKKGNKFSIFSNKTEFVAKVEFEENTELPKDSPFKNWKEARRFAGPLPNTFTFNPKTNEVLIIKGLRQNWRPNPVKVLEYKIPFLEELNLKNPILANAFQIENIPYEWEKGRTEKWNTAK